MAKVTRAKIDLENLYVDFDLNQRYSWNYDLNEMKDSIMQTGKILDLLKVEDMGNGRYRVLQGNRRTLSAQELVKAESTPDDVKKALSKLEADVYRDLSERERDDLVQDDGGKKPLSRAETIQSIWRSHARGYDFQGLVVKHFESITRLTSNSKKAAEYKAETDQTKRKSIARLWLQGILNDYILAANDCGQMVRDQVIINELIEDGLIDAKKPEAWPENVKGKFVFSLSNVKRVKELWKAMQEDRKFNEWNPIKETGPRFAAKVDEFVAKDAEPRKERNTDDGPWNKAKLESKAMNYRSTTIKFTLLRAAGIKNKDGELICNLDEIDKECERQELVTEYLKNKLDNFKETNKPLHALLTAIVYNKPETVGKRLSEMA